MCVCSGLARCHHRYWDVHAAHLMQQLTTGIQQDTLHGAWRQERS